MTRVIPDHHHSQHPSEERLRHQIQEDWSGPEAEAIAMHLLTCEACRMLEEHLLEKTIAHEQAQRDALLVGERPLDRPMSWRPDEDYELLERLSRLLGDAHQERRHGIVLFSHAAHQARRAADLLRRLSFKLKEQGHPVQLLLPQGPTLQRGLIPGLPDDDLLLLQMGPESTYIDWPQTLADLAARRVLLVSGEAESLARWSGRGDLPEPLASLQLVEDPLSRERLERDQQALLDGQEVQEILSGSARQALVLIALLDALGVYAPLSLVTRQSGLPEEELVQLLQIDSQTPGLVYRVQGRQHLLCLRDTLLAEGLLKRILAQEQDPPEQAYLRLVRAADVNQRSEAGVVVTLFARLVDTGRLGLLRSLATGASDVFQRLGDIAGVDELVALARTLTALREFDMASELLSKGLEQEPENPFLRHAAARLLARQSLALRDEEKYQKAILQFRAVPTLPDADRGTAVVALHAEGDLCARWGNSRAARQRWHEVLDLDPGNVHALVSLARLEAEEGSVESARGRLESAERAAPHSPVVQHVRGMLARRQGDYQAAESAFKRVLALAPGNIPALHALGVMATERGQFAQARSLLEKARHVDTANVLVLHALGELDLEGGKRGLEASDQEARQLFEYAVERFNEVLEQEPGNLPALTSLARALAYLDRAREARERLEEARRKEPVSPRVFAVEATLALRQGHSDQAVRVLERTLASLRGTARLPLLTQLAEAQRAMGMVSEAKAGLEEAVRLSQRAGIWARDRVLTLNALAGVERSDGTVERAEQLYREALQIDPDNTITLRGLAALLRERSDAIQAEQYQNRARKLQGETFE